MDIINIFEAKTKLSQLIARVLQGEEIVIAKNNKPVAKLTPYTPLHQKRKGNQWKGKVIIPKNFDQEDPDIMALFEEQSK